MKTADEQTAHAVRVTLEHSACRMARDSDRRCTRMATVGVLDDDGTPAELADGYCWHCVPTGCDAFYVELEPGAPVDKVGV